MMSLTEIACSGVIPVHSVFPRSVPLGPDDAVAARELDPLSPAVEDANDTDPVRTPALTSQRRATCTSRAAGWSPSALSWAVSDPRGALAGSRDGDCWQPRRTATAAATRRHRTL